ncbi:MAG: VWA domain-containing protein [Rhodospirillaceae bacterium]|nr:VWA domain-containing protein [Rhodospirillaceae bacterium]
MTALLFRSTAITAAVLALAACGPAPDSGNRTTDTVDEERSLRTESPQAVAEFEDGIAGGIAVAPTIVAGEPMPMPLPPPQYDPFSEQYEDVDLNPVHLVSEDPVSTFSSDVDTAAYANVRRYITDGQTPPRDAVRIEEMINYFDYDYAGPEDAVPPFAATVAVAPTPWNEDTQILHIGIQGYDIDLSERPRANLVFLVDVSGSMEGSDRLPLLQQSLRMLTEQLQDDDTVSIVTYAGGVRVVLEPTPGSQRNRILAAIDHLQSGGSTAGAAGIEQAYELARRNFDEDAVNRVILGTDGDFNVGIADPNRLEDYIAEQRETGIYLSILGFGRGNLNDLLMQRLAQAGNGNAAYIDGLLEARRVLVDEMSSTLFPIADDLKIQVEFNSAVVAEYRLIGYETRALNREDFNNDQVDAGDIGSGHSVTAIYEIVPVDSPARLVDDLRYGDGGTAPVIESDGAHAGEYAFLRIRYKLPGEDTSRLIERPITVADVYETIDAAPESTRFAAAVAAFGQLLRGDPYLGSFGFDDVYALAQGARGDDPFGLRAEFVQLVRTAEVSQPQVGQR